MNFGTVAILAVSFFLVLQRMGASLDGESFALIHTSIGLQMAEIDAFVTFEY